MRTDIQTERYRDRQAGRQADGQTDKHTDIHKYAYPALSKHCGAIVKERAVEGAVIGSKHLFVLIM